MAEAASCPRPREASPQARRIHLGPRHCGRTSPWRTFVAPGKELRAVGDTEIVSVEDKDETVKIGRVGDKVRIHVDGRGKGESVSIEVPTAAVDALLSGEGEELNLRGALQEIRHLRGDVVRVDGDDSKVRIWIDEGI